MKLISHRLSAGMLGKTIMAVFLLFALTAGVNARGVPGGDAAGVKSALDGSGVSADGEFASGEEHFERFGDFTVLLKDQRGRERILVCTVIVKLNRGAHLPEQRIGLRKVIYGTLKERSGATDMRKGLRKVIKKRLNVALPGHRIQDVYFTKFVLL